MQLCVHSVSPLYFKNEFTKIIFIFFSQLRKTFFKIREKNWVKTESSLTKIYIIPKK